MLAGVMLFGILAAMAMPSFGDDDWDADSVEPGDEDEAPGQAGLADTGSGDMFDDVAGDEAADETGRDYLAAGSSGVTVIDGFLPGQDSLTLRVPEDAEEFLLSDSGENAPASLSYTSLDDETAIWFPGLETVPVDDIAVLVDGEGEPIALAEYLGAPEPGEEETDGEDDNLPPDDPEIPSLPGAPDQPGEVVLPPDDPEIPSQPGDPDQPDDEALPPDDPELPAVPGAEDGLSPAGEAEEETDEGGATLWSAAADEPAAPLPDDAVLLKDPAVVTGFTPGQDILHIEISNGGADGMAGIALVQSGSDTMVQLDGQTIAVLQGVADASLADLQVETAPG